MTSINLQELDNILNLIKNGGGDSCTIDAVKTAINISSKKKKEQLKYFKKQNTPVRHNNVAENAELLAGLGQ